MSKLSEKRSSLNLHYYLKPTDRYGRSHKMPFPARSCNTNYFRLWRVCVACHGLFVKSLSVLLLYFVIGPNDMTFGVDDFNDVYYTNRGRSCLHVDMCF